MSSHVPSLDPWRAKAMRHSDAVRRALVAVAGFSAVNAIGGGLGLLVNGLGIPTTQLEGTLFSSFTIPALILTIGVGGSMVTATIAVAQRAPRGGDVAMVAGAVMLGWIGIEAAMIHDGRPLQVVVAVLSLATIVLGYLHQQSLHAAWHGPDARRQ